MDKTSLNQTLGVWLTRGEWKWSPSSGIETEQRPDGLARGSTRSKSMWVNSPSFHNGMGRTFQIGPAIAAAKLNEIKSPKQIIPLGFEAKQTTIDHEQ